MLILVFFIQKAIIDRNIQFFPCSPTLYTLFESNRYEISHIWLSKFPCKRLPEKYKMFNIDENRKVKIDQLFSLSRRLIDKKPTSQPWTICGQILLFGEMLKSPPPQTPPPPPPPPPPTPPPNRKIIIKNRVLSTESVKRIVGGR